MTDEYKTYVWEDVLCDYSCGLIAVKARTEEEAWRILEEKDKPVYRVVRSEEDSEPRILEEGDVVYVWGG